MYVHLIFWNEEHYDMGTIVFSVEKKLPRQICKQEIRYYVSMFAEWYALFYSAHNILNEVVVERRKNFVVITPLPLLPKKFDKTKEWVCSETLPNNSRLVPLV